MRFSVGDSERGYLTWFIGLASVVDAGKLDLIKALQECIARVYEIAHEEQLLRDDFARNVGAMNAPAPGEICPCCKVRAWTWPESIDPDTGHYEHET